VRRFMARVVADDAMDSYVGAKGKRRILRLSAGDATALGVEKDSLIEILGRNPAPLRAWVRVEEGPEGVVRLDAFARNVLAVEDGGEVMLRPLPGPNLPNGMAE